MSALHTPQRKPASPEVRHRRSLSRRVSKAMKRAGVKVSRTADADANGYLNATDEHLWEVFRRWREINIRRLRPGDPPRYVFFSFRLFLLEVCCGVREAGLCAKNFRQAWDWWLRFDEESCLKIVYDFRIARMEQRRQERKERSLSGEEIERYLFAQVVSASRYQQVDEELDQSARYSAV